MSQQDSSFLPFKVELPMEENEVFVRKEDEEVVQTDELQTSTKEAPNLIPEPSVVAAEENTDSQNKTEPSLVTPTQTQVKFDFQTPDTSVKQTEETSNNPSTEEETPSNTRPRKYSVNHEETIDEVENIHKKSENKTLYADEFIAEVDRHYLNVAFYAVIIYLSLMSISFMVGEKYDALRTLEGMERKPPMLASLLLGMSLISCVLPLFVRGNKRCMSGVIVCAVLVQSLALITDVMVSANGA